MQISEIKLELFRYIDNLENNKLQQIYKYLISDRTDNIESDFWLSLNEWQKNDINSGISDLEEGRKKSFDKVISKYE
jgi:hypothetical protein